MAGKLKRNITNLKGESGGEFINASAATGNFEYIQALTDATISAITFAPGFVNAGSDSLVGAVIPKGMALPWRVTAITLSAGSVWAVNRVAE